MTEADVDARGARILVVDDTPHTLEALPQALEEAGYQVMVADSGPNGPRAGGGLRARPDPPGRLHAGYERHERLRRLPAP